MLTWLVRQPPTRSDYSQLWVIYYYLLCVGWTKGNTSLKSSNCGMDGAGDGGGARNFIRGDHRTSRRQAGSASSQVCRLSSPFRRSPRAEGFRLQRQSPSISVTRSGGGVLPQSPPPGPLPPHSLANRPMPARAAFFPPALHLPRMSSGSRGAAAAARHRARV